jgi:hypothetical protein
MDAPRPRDTRWRLGVLIAAAAFWIVDLGMLGAGLPHLLDDTWEYAVSAQHLLAGDGFVTRVIHPPLWSLRGAEGYVPLLVHGPLLPLVFAGGLTLFGAAFVDHVAWLSAAFALIAALLIARLGTRLAGAPVGAAAALMFTVAPLTVQAVHHDVALTAGAALLAGAIAVLSGGRIPSAPGAARAALAGALVGLGMLARAEFLLLAPLLAVCAGRRAWAALGGAALIVAPWWMHTAAAVGTPFFNLSSYLLIGYRPGSDGLAVLRDFDLTPGRWPQVLADAWPELPAKWIDALPHALKRAALAPTAAAGALATIGGIAALTQPRLRAAALVTVAATLIPLTIMTVMVYDARYVTPFLPLWTLAAAYGAATLAARLPDPLRAPRVWLALLALLVLPPGALAVREAASGRAADAATLAEGRHALAAFAPRGGETPRVMFSDTPDFAAWTTGRPTVWLSRTEHERLPFCGAAGAGRTPAGAETAALPNLSTGAPMRALPCQGGPGDVYFHP